MAKPKFKLTILKIDSVNIVQGFFTLDLTLKSDRDLDSHEQFSAHFRKELTRLGLEQFDLVQTVQNFSGDFTARCSQKLPNTQEV